MAIKQTRVEALFRYTGTQIPANSTVTIAEVDTSPNGGINILAKGDQQYTLRVYEADRYDGATFNYTDFTIPISGDTVEILPYGSRVVIQVLTAASPTTPNIRAFPKAVK